MAKNTPWQPRYAEWNGLDYWKFQAVETLGGNVRLWYLMPGEKVWQIGHTIPVNGRMSFGSVADLMRRYTLGLMSYAEYNELLPHRTPAPRNARDSPAFGFDGRRNVYRTEQS